MIFRIFSSPELSLSDDARGVEYSSCEGDSKLTITLRSFRSDCRLNRDRQRAHCSRLCSFRHWLCAKFSLVHLHTFKRERSSCSWQNLHRSFRANLRNCSTEDSEGLSALWIEDRSMFGGLKPEELSCELLLLSRPLAKPVGIFFCTFKTILA